MQDSVKNGDLAIAVLQKLLRERRQWSLTFVDDNFWFSLILPSIKLTEDEAIYLTKLGEKI